MPGETVNTLMDELIDQPLSVAERSAVEAQLTSSAEGRRLYDLHRQLQAMPETVDVTRGVMRRLPDGPPGLYARIAALVLQAWTDPDLRERLRTAPREVLVGAGIAIPAATRVAIVAPGDAMLPAAGWIALPLPPSDSPPVAPAEARSRLAATEFGWLGQDAARAMATVPSRARLAGLPSPAGAGLLERLARFWSAPLPRPVQWPLGTVVIAGAGAALVVVGLVMAGQSFTGARISGAAAPAVGGASVALLAGLGALVVLAFLALRRGR
jgi:hypothetical protein